MTMSNELLSYLPAKPIYKFR